MRAIFLDRDGTITVGTPTYERVDSLDKVVLLPQSLAALALLSKLEYMVFFITNQAGVAEGLITDTQFHEINDKVLELIQPSGITITKTYICPHGEGSTCGCRKPKPGLLLQAAAEYDIDLSQSWMIGDRVSDVMTGVNAGTKTILVRTGIPTVESSLATQTVPTLLQAAEYIAAH